MTTIANNVEGVNNIRHPFLPLRDGVNRPRHEVSREKFLLFRERRVNRKVPSGRDFRCGTSKFVNAAARQR